MKKRIKKLEVHRETVRQLVDGESPEALRKVDGATQVVAVFTSCIQPDCCGFDTR